MTVKSYRLTPEFFADRLQVLEQRKAHLTERKVELLDLLHQTQATMQSVDEQIGRIGADEKLAAELHARYGPGEAAELPKTRAKPRRPTPKRPVPSGRPWTASEEAAVMAADPEDDEVLAAQFDRKIGSIEKRRRKIRRERLVEVGPAAVADPEPDSQKEIDKALFEPLHALDEELDRQQSSSENPEISEPTEPVITDGEKRRAGPPTPRLDSTAARELAEFDGRLQRRPQAKPGRDVSGSIVDNGRLDQRVYDPIAHASREPR